MKLEQVYDGRFFPCYYYEPNAITIAVTSKAEPEDTEHITWLFLPMVQEEIDRASFAGASQIPPMSACGWRTVNFPMRWMSCWILEYENLSDLNELAAATDGLSKADMEKLGAVVTLAEPKSAAQIKNLAKNLDLFDFAPDAHSPADYGKYMIRQSGRFEYDENLDAFYDYEKYGAERMNEEDGMFTDRGYIAYKGITVVNVVDNGKIRCCFREYVLFALVLRKHRGWNIRRSRQFDFLHNSSDSHHTIYHHLMLKKEIVWLFMWHGQQQPFLIASLSVILPIG